MTPTPLISVITVCYNIKDEIERTCQSIISQTAHNFEWIVIDGGSTDGTVEILNKYKDKITLFISEKDSGIYNAMNKGIKKASGDWLLFLNGGDCFAGTDIIEKFIALNGVYQYADIIYGDVNLINLDGTKKIKKYAYPLTKAYFFSSTLNHQSVFIKRDLFEKYGLYNEDYKIISDWEKWIVFIINNCKFMKWEYVISDFYTGGISSKKLSLLNQEINDVNQKYFIAGDLEGHFYQGKKYGLLFNKIPLFYIKKKTNPFSLTLKLFNFIPIYAIKKKNNVYVHYLFAFIPFFSMRDK